MRTLLLALLLLNTVTVAAPQAPVFPAHSSSQAQIPAQESQQRLLAHIRLHTVAELVAALARAEQWFDDGRWQAGRDAPVAFVLHGAEARALLRDNYRAHKTLVDLAARLSALGVLRIQVCETWMGGEGLDASQLQPFVGTVPEGPAEEQRLLEVERYRYF